MDTPIHSFSVFWFPAWCYSFLGGRHSHGQCRQKLLLLLSNLYSSGTSYTNNWAQLLIHWKWNVIHFHKLGQVKETALQCITMLNNSGKILFCCGNAWDGSHSRSLVYWVVLGWESQSLGYWAVLGWKPQSLGY